MSQSTVEHQVARALEQSPHLVNRNLRFEMSEGRVTLRGVVRSYYQKQMAQETLRRVQGISTIENQLEVCW